MSGKDVTKVQRIERAVYDTAIIFVALLSVGALVYWVTTTPEWAAFLRRFAKPCQNPILYSLDTFDARFGISKSTFLADIQKAENIWEQAAGKQLFAYDQAHGTLTINLIYDDRQAATVKLQKLGITLKDDRATYDALKLKYDQMSAELIRKQSALTALQKAYQQDVAALNAEIARSNAHRGATRSEYDLLNSKQASVDAEYVQMKQAQDDLNAFIDTLNAVTAVLNQKAKIFNTTVSGYNTIGSSTGKSFDEGLYVQTSTSTSINIYQFDDQAKLIRVLAHEMGHALGLDHVSDPKAIMYFSNMGTNEKLTAADVTELKALCGIK